MSLPFMCTNSGIKKGGGFCLEVCVRGLGLVGDIHRSTDRHRQQHRNTHTCTLWPSNLKAAVNLNHNRHNDFLPKEVYSLALRDSVGKVAGRKMGFPQKHMMSAYVDFQSGVTAHTAHGEQEHQLQPHSVTRQSSDQEGLTFQYFPSVLIARSLFSVSCRHSGSIRISDLLFAQGHSQLTEKAGWTERKKGIKTVRERQR